MSEVTKMFAHEGARTPETDALSEELARHTLLHDHPTATNIETRWVHHNIPDYWLLFATGEVADE